MTKTLEAGPELDAQVAKVMGIDLDGTRPDLPIRGIGCKPYSSDWSAAGEVFLWVRQQDKDMQQRFYDGLAAQWRQWCSTQETEGMTEDEWAEIHLITGTSRWFILYADIPLAISLAALEAVKQVKQQES